MTAATPPGPRDWLDELEALREAATPGPWQYDPSEGDTVWDADEKWPSIIALARDPYGHCEADAALIVAAVNALGPLVGALRAVEALAERYEATAARRTKLAEKFERRGRDNTAEDFRALADDSRLHANRLRAAIGDNAPSPSSTDRSQP